MTELTLLQQLEEQLEKINTDICTYNTLLNGKKITRDAILDKINKLEKELDGY